MHKVESEAVADDLKKLERVLSEWEPTKTEALMDANPANITVDTGPDPYAAELYTQRQRLAAVRFYLLPTHETLNETRILPEKSE